MAKTLTAKRREGSVGRMKEIDRTFEGRADQRKYRFRLVQRQGRIALFKKQFKSGEGWRGFEVVRLVESPARAFTVEGRAVETEARETMPSPENWGTDGFSFCDLEAARAKFNAMGRNTH
jgi:hypothetical protein